MGEVIDFPGWTKVPLEADKVLSGALGKLEHVLILGVGKDGEIYASTSNPDSREWVYLCAQFQHKLFRGDFG